MRIERIGSHIYQCAGAHIKAGRNLLFYLLDDSSATIEFDNLVNEVSANKIHVVFFFSATGEIDLAKIILPSKNYGTLSWQNTGGLINVLELTNERRIPETRVEIVEAFHLFFSRSTLQWVDEYFKIETVGNSVVRNEHKEFSFSSMQINLDGSIYFDVKSVTEPEVGMGIPYYKEELDTDGILSFVKSGFSIFDKNDPLDFSFQVHGFSTEISLTRENVIIPVLEPHGFKSSNLKTNKGIRALFMPGTFRYVIDRYVTNRDFSNPSSYSAVILPQGRIRMSFPKTVNAQKQHHLLMGSSGSEHILLEDEDEIEFVPGDEKNPFAAFLDVNDPTSSIKTFSSFIQDAKAPYIPTSWIKIHKKNLSPALYTNQPEISAYYRNIKSLASDSTTLFREDLTAGKLQPDQALPFIPVNDEENVSYLVELNESINKERYKLLVSMYNAGSASPQKENLVTSQAYTINVDPAEGKVDEYDFVRTLGKSSSFKIQTTSNRRDFQVSLQKENTFFVLSSKLLVHAKDAILKFDSNIILEDFRFEFFKYIGDPKPAENNCVTLFKYSNIPVKDYLFGDVADSSYYIKKWSNSESFSSLAILPELKRVRLLLIDKYELARAKISEGNEEYRYLYDIFENPFWQGVLVIDIPLNDRNNLPSIIRGLSSSQELSVYAKPDYSNSVTKRQFTAGLKAEFLAFPMNQTYMDEGKLAIKQTSFFGLIDYDLERNEQSDDFVKGIKDYLQSDGPESGCKFLMTKLLIRFASSRITSFASKALVRIPAVLGESIKITDAKYGENIFALNGQYQRLSNQTGKYLFEAVFDNASYVNRESAAFIRKIQLKKLAFSLHDAAKDEYRFDIDGSIQFNELPGIREIFDFEEGILDFKNIGFRFDLKSLLPAVKIDLSKIVCLPKFKIGGKGLLKSFPFRFNRFEWLDEAVNIRNLGFIPIAKSKLSIPKFALVFDFDLGSLGDLSFLKKIKGEFLLGWKPGKFDPSDIWRQMSLGLKIDLPDPEGDININIAGVLKLKIREVDLCKFTYREAGLNKTVFFLRLVDLRLQILSLKLPKKKEQEFGGLIFTNPFDDNIKSAWFAVFNDKTEDPLLKYLAFGQRFGPPEQIMKEIIDVDHAIEKTKEYLLYDYIPPYDGDFCKSPEFGMIRDSYQPERKWIIATQLNIEDLLNLGIIFNDPVLYGLSLELKMQGSLSGLKVQILYRRLSDSLGVWSTDVRLPAVIRNQEFGAVSLTLPDFAMAIYTNGDWYFDIGYPKDLDFKRSCLVQIRPFVGWGGFYGAKYTSAEMFKNLFHKDLDPYWHKDSAYLTVQTGFAFRVGIGAYIDKGIFYAGASISVFGILEGAFVFEKNERGLEKFVPDAFALKGRTGIIAEIIGYVDFKIIKASIHIWLSVEYGLALAAVHGNWGPIVLHIEGRVSVSVSITIACFRIFRKRICIVIHLSFAARIRFEYTINGNSNKQASIASGTKRLSTDDRDTLDIQTVRLPFAFVPEISKGKNSRNEGTETYTWLHTQFYITLQHSEGADTNFHELVHLIDQYDKLLTAELADYHTTKQIIVAFIKERLDIYKVPVSFIWHELAEMKSVNVNSFKPMIVPAPTGYKVDYSDFLGRADAVINTDPILVSQAYVDKIEENFDAYRTEYIDRKNNRTASSTVDLRNVIWKDYIQMLLLCFVELLSSRDLGWAELKKDKTQKDQLLLDLVGMMNMFYRNGLVLPGEKTDDVIPFISLCGQSVVVNAPANTMKEIWLKQGDTVIEKFTTRDAAPDGTTVDSITETAQEIDRFLSMDIDTRVGNIMVEAKGNNLRLIDIKKFEDIETDPYELKNLTVTLSKSSVEITEDASGSKFSTMFEVPDLLRTGKALECILKKHTLNEQAALEGESAGTELTALSVTYFELLVTEKSGGEVFSSFTISNTKAADLKLLNDLMSAELPGLTLQLYLKPEDNLSMQRIQKGCTIFKTNSSPKTHPPIIIDDSKARSAASENDESFTAHSDNAVEFLRLLHEALLTNSGGFYLESEIAKSELPVGKIKMAVIVRHGSKDITSLANKILYEGIINAENEYVSAEEIFLKDEKDEKGEKIYFKEYVPTIPANCFGFQIKRPKEKLEGMHNADDATSRYILMEFSQSGVLSLSEDKILPIMPLEKDNDWSYKHVSPVSQPGLGYYSGIGQETKLKLGWRDVYGYRAGVMTEELVYTHEYFDRLISIEQWPYIKCRYRYMGQNGSKIKWQLIVSADLDVKEGEGLKAAFRKILFDSDSNLVAEDLQGLKNKFSIINDQLNDSNVSLSVFGQTIPIKNTFDKFIELFVSISMISTATTSDELDKMLKPVPPMIIEVEKDYAGLHSNELPFEMLNLTVVLKRDRHVHRKLASLMKKTNIYGVKEVQEVSFNPGIELDKDSTEVETFARISKELEKGGVFRLGVGAKQGAASGVWLLNEKKILENSAVINSAEQFGFRPLMTSLFSGSYKGLDFSSIDLDQSFRMVLDRIEILLSATSIANGIYRSEVRKIKFNGLNRLKKRLAAHLASETYINSFYKQVSPGEAALKELRHLLLRDLRNFYFYDAVLQYKTEATGSVKFRSNLALKPKDEISKLLRCEPAKIGEGQSGCWTLLVDYASDKTVSKVFGGSFDLELKYLEYNIRSLKKEHTKEPYEMSDWIELLNPLGLGTVSFANCPLIQRTFPAMPRIINQKAVQKHENIGNWNKKEAGLWNYQLQLNLDEYGVNERVYIELQLPVINRNLAEAGEKEELNFEAIAFLGQLINRRDFQTEELLSEDYYPVLNDLLVNRKSADRSAARTDSGNRIRFMVQKENENWVCTPLEIIDGIEFNRVIEKNLELKGLDVFKRHYYLIASVYVTRNEFELDRIPIKKEFVYKTEKVRSLSPVYPLITYHDRIDFKGHLFDELVKELSTDGHKLRAEIYYKNKLNQHYAFKNYIAMLVTNEPLENPMLDEQFDDSFEGTEAVSGACMDLSVFSQHYRDMDDRVIVEEVPIFKADQLIKPVR
jgi:hypothetical protein